MTTRIFTPDEASLIEAARLIRAGEVVAFPTETVYGLGGNGYDPEAVRRIFAAKERPADNPLIYHIHSLAQWEELVQEIPAPAAALAEVFWPGPLTIILPAKDTVPGIGRAGLATVGVRMPDHPVALDFLKACGVPVAAPSANRSGRPSPTRAQDVYLDMQGRIPAILDGGSCRVGLESTVIAIDGDRVQILRPGGVTKAMLETVLPQVTIHASALAPVQEGASAPSPGMLHRHYAPRAKVLVAQGSPGEQRDAICAAYDAHGGRAVILATEENLPYYQSRETLLWGRRAEPGTLAEALFSRLRDADAREYDLVLAEAVEPEGLGLAVMNRLLRAANFERLSYCLYGRNPL